MMLLWGLYGWGVWLWAILQGLVNHLPGGLIVLRHCE